MAFPKSISKISISHRHAFRRGSTPTEASSLDDAVFRISLGFASLLLASGVFHIGVWGFLGGEWEGDVSWRKPILFGLSAGMTLASFSWLYHRILPTARTRLALSLLSTSLLLEVALITLQQWRGVTSHFNRSTLFDRVIDQSMTGLILLATASIIPMAVAVFRTVGLPSDLRLAVRAGIVFLFLSCFIGVIIWLHGLQRLNLGLPPAQVGTAGIPKFPHGVSIHALQLFPITCWILTNRLANAKPTDGHQVPCSEPRDPTYFQHLSNGERKGTFRNGHSRAHSVRTRHGLSDSHDFRIFSSMPFLGDPKRREAEFFTRGMMGRKQTASKKGRNGSLDTAPLPPPIPARTYKSH